MAPSGPDGAALARGPRPTGREWPPARAGMSPLLRPLRLPGEVAGRVWLSAMPGRTAPLAAFLHAAREAGASALVCLAPEAQIAACAPDYARARMQGTLGLRLIDHPIPDFGVPGDAAAFAQLMGDLRAALEGGQGLVVHCAAGIGRTGLVAQCLLMALGEGAEAARAAVLAAGSGPETPQQQAFAQMQGDILARLRLGGDQAATPSPSR